MRVQLVLLFSFALVFMMLSPNLGMKDGVSISAIKSSFSNKELEASFVKLLSEKIHLDFNFLIPFISTPDHKLVNSFFEENTNNDAVTWAILSKNITIPRLLHELGLRKANVTRENILLACHQAEVIYPLLVIFRSIEVSGNSYYLFHRAHHSRAFLLLRDFVGLYCRCENFDFF